MEHFKEYIISKKRLTKPSDFVDFSKISKEEILSQCVDLRMHLCNKGFGGKIHISENNEILFEELNKTISVKQTIYEMKRQLGFKDWQFYEYIWANNIEVVCIFVDYAKNKDIVIDSMKSLGWSISFSNKETINIDGRDIEVIAIHFDPMYQNNINNEVRKSEYLYHISPEKYKESILNNGLIPKSENRLYMYPNKVHLLKDIKFIDQEIISLGKQLRNVSKETNPDYIVYKIQIDKLPDNIDFYYDPRYENGYYTKNSIPKEAIEIYGTVNLETDEEIHHTNISF